MLLLEAVCSPRRLITVTICDAGRLHTWLRRHELNATTLAMAGSSVPYALRRRAYKQLPVFERLFWPVQALETLRNSLRQSCIYLFAAMNSAQIVTSESDKVSTPDNRPGPLVH